MDRNNILHFQHLRQQLECSICISNTCDKILQCGHSFCSNCLERLITQGSILCAQCRSISLTNIIILMFLLAVTKIQAVHSLPTNFLAIQLSEELHRIPWCQTHHYVQDLWCLQCAEPLCQSCAISHNPSHILKLITEVSHYTRTSLETIQTYCETWKLQYSRTLLEEATKRSSLEHEIKQAFDEHLKELIRCRDDLLRKARQLTEQSESSQLASQTIEDLSAFLGETLLKENSKNQIKFLQSVSKALSKRHSFVHHFLLF